MLVIFLGSFFWTDTHWLEDFQKQGFQIPLKIQEEWYLNIYIYIYINNWYLKI